MKNRSYYEGYIVGNNEKSQNNYVYREGNGEKKSFLAMTISVRRPFAKKDENTGYYPYDFFSVKAFGAVADFINKNFTAGDPIQLACYEVMEPGNTKEDGTKYPARKVAYVTEADFVTSRRGENNHASAQKAADPVSEPMPSGGFFDNPF